MRLMIYIKRRPNGTYRASCPALPGCCAGGLSHEDALRKMEAAIHGYLASLNAPLTAELQTRVMEGAAN